MLRLSVYRLLLPASAVTFSFLATGAWRDGRVEAATAWTLCTLMAAGVCLVVALLDRMVDTLLEERQELLDLAEATLRQWDDFQAAFPLAVKVRIEIQGDKKVVVVPVNLN